MKDCEQHTFVVCVYKESRYLEECIESLLAQTVKSKIVMVTSTPNNFVNKIAEKYNGGGHKLASGARLVSFEEVEYLIKDLDKACEKYIKESEVYED